MKHLLLAVAAALAACNLEHSLDNSTPEPEVIDERHCAMDSAQMADTLNYIRCWDVGPPTPVNTEPRPVGPGAQPGSADLDTLALGVP